MLKKNSYIYYPYYGIGKVLGSEIKKIKTGKEKYYKLSMLNMEMVLYVPFKEYKNAGIRPIVTKTESERIIKYLTGKIKNLKLNKEEQRKIKEDDIQDKLKDGNIRILSEFLKKNNKKFYKKLLTPNQKKFYEKALDIVLTELQLSLNKKIDYLDKKFGDSFHIKAKKLVYIEKKRKRRKKKQTADKK